MDAHTFSGSRSGVVLAAIIDELPEAARQNIRRRVSSQLCEARALVKVLANIRDERLGLYVLRLVRRDHLDRATSSSLPPKIQTFLCNVLTVIFRGAVQKFKQSFVDPEECDSEA